MLEIAGEVIEILITGIILIDRHVNVAQIAIICCAQCTIKSSFKKAFEKLLTATQRTQQNEKSVLVGTFS